MFKQIINLLLITTLTLASASAMAGGEGKKLSTLQGKVIDGSTYEGLAGATIEVEGTDVKVYTDFDGNFTLPALPEGTYTIKSTSISYNEVKLRNIKITPENTSLLELKLHTN